MVFTSIAIIEIIATPANALLGILPEAASILAAFDRIQAYLVIPTLNDKREFLDELANSSEAIKVEDASIRPAPTADLVLKNISTAWTKGDLVVVSGAVGSGKTSLARALLGELAQDSGVIQTAFESAAYCSQVAWLVNGTVKEVICAGTENEELYKRVVHACDLEEDLARMPQGDQTVIGSRGIILSGGQKQRIVSKRSHCPNSWLTFRPSRELPLRARSWLSWTTYCRRWMLQRSVMLPADFLVQAVYSRSSALQFYSSPIPVSFCT